MDITDRTDGRIIKKLREYASLLAAASSSARLTGPRDEDDIYRSLIVDCLYSVPFFDGCKSVIDVGTGGGIPGMVLAIAMPDARFVLLDSITKKTVLVREIARALGCANVEVVNARSEEYAATVRESFDAATARAVANAPTLAEYLTPFVRVGGAIVACKGSAVHDELSPAAGAWGALGLSAPEITPYEHEGKDLCVVKWIKRSKCPSNFPRRPGEAAKHPWYAAARPRRQ